MSDELPFSRIGYSFCASRGVMTLSPLCDVKRRVGFYREVVHYFGG